MLHKELCDKYQLNAIKELIPKYCSFLNAEAVPKDVDETAQEMLILLLTAMFTDEIPLAKKWELNI